jgi:reverse transcriptase-like protein
MDIKLAFLNGVLNKEIYMEQPQGFIIADKKNKVY